MSDIEYDGSEPLITYKYSNKDEKYYALPAEDRIEIDDIVAMFIKELLTVKGTNMFDRDYGCTFMDDISGPLNIYKVEYLLKNNYKDLYDKYGIVSVEVIGAEKNVQTGFLDVRIKIYFNDLSVTHYTQFIHDGEFTDRIIIELEK